MVRDIPSYEFAQRQERLAEQEKIRCSLAGCRIIEVRLLETEAIFCLEGGKQVVIKSVSHHGSHIELEKH